MGRLRQGRLLPHLNELNHTREALWNGDFGGAPQLLTTSADESVFAFYKQKGESTVVVVLNFSADAQTVKLALPEAELTPVMGGFDVTGWEAGQEMAPYSYAVFATAS